MKTTEFKVLLIERSGMRNKMLIEILSNLDIFVVIANTIDSAFQKAISFSPDLIICQEDFGEYTGFQVYNMLEREILRNGIPFIVMLSDYNKHSIMMGEELGVDGFIFPPYEVDKIFNILRTKIRKFKANQIRTLRYFKKLYELIPLGIFIAENRKIVEANKYLKNILDVKGSYTFTTIDELFDLETVPEENLKLSRLLNGLDNSINLNSICLKSDPSSRFDLNLFYLENGMPGLKIIGILIPTSGNNVVLTLSDEESNNTQPVSPVNNLFTKRERQILDLSGEGLPIKLIADKLNISERTVEKHRSNILQKTNTGNIIQALAYVNKHQFQTG